jgi:hypothetical protein
MQMCIDSAPASAGIEIPRGWHFLDRQVVVTRPITIRTAGSANRTDTCTSAPESCAMLIAAPGFADEFGILAVHSTSDVILEHIVFDGNRAARLTSLAAEACRTGRNTAGVTAAILGCERCRLHDVVARHALCGSGMIWIGGEAHIERSDFRDNGDRRPGMWADGLTALYAPDAQIVENRFYENSDVGLILGYGVRARIERNHIRQREQLAFAGLMLDNFNSDDLAKRGDFRHARIANNTIDCRPLRCVFGIQVGPRPWYPTRNVIGGEIRDNEIHGAKIGINADGAGTPAVPVSIFSNRVTDLPDDETYFVGCPTPVPAVWMNVAPTSVVHRVDETTQTGAYLTDRCQLWSPVEPLAP